jgi:hypothetical protein
METNMRTTKVLAFSVPPEFESIITRSAKMEHRTVSEFIREAVRQYVKLQGFEQTRKTVSRKVKRLGAKPSDVEDELRKIRHAA